MLDISSWRLPAGRRGAALALAGAYASLSAVMFRQETAMKVEGGPGIVGFELAGSVERVDAILHAWGDRGAAAARRSLLIDYAVLGSYSPLMAILCSDAAERLRSQGRDRLSALGPLVSRAQLVAGACDAVENSALLAVLSGRRGALPAIARRSAQTKFALLSAGGIYLTLAVASRSPA